jgi:hypothetical protein
MRISHVFCITAMGNWRTTVKALFVVTAVGLVGGRGVNKLAAGGNGESARRLDEILLLVVARWRNCERRVEADDDLDRDESERLDMVGVRGSLVCTGDCG